MSLHTSPCNRKWCLQHAGNRSTFLALSRHPIRGHSNSSFPPTSKTKPNQSITIDDRCDAETAIYPVPICNLPHLISSHLISSHLISFHLISSHLIRCEQEPNDRRQVFDHHVTPVTTMDQSMKRSRAIRARRLYRLVIFMTAFSLPRWLLICTAPFGLQSTRMLSIVFN